MLDLADHDAYVAGVPHAGFADLGRQNPVDWNEGRDGMRGL